jgi:hypothetical protein
MSPSRSSCRAAAGAIDEEDGVRRILTLALLRSTGTGFRNNFRAVWAIGLGALEDSDDEATGGGGGGAEEDEATDWSGGAVK